MARRRRERNPSSWIATAGSLLLLVAVGFGVGAVAGILWEEPRLVLAHLTGGTTEIAWTADSQSRVVAPVQPEAQAAAPLHEGGPAVELPAVAAAPPGRVAIQVGAFGDSAAAEELAAHLRGRGYSVYVTPGARSDAPRWRVRVGPLVSREEAERIAVRLKTEERLPTWVLDDDGG